MKQQQHTQAAYTYLLVLLFGQLVHGFHVVAILGNEVVRCALELRGEVLCEYCEV